MPFKKGQSGNPGGRVGVPKAFREQCQAHTQTSFDNLKRWEKSDHPQASVAASKEILDRAWGKAGQPLVDAEGKTYAILVAMPAEKELIDNL